MNENGKLLYIFPNLSGWDLSVEDMDLEVAVRNALKRSGIHTLAQLLRLNHTELVQVFPNRKLRSYEEVIHRLVCLSDEPKAMNTTPDFESVEDTKIIEKKFNIFQVAGIYKSEEIHTSVIAELLNPQSCFHNKGDGFLDKFLQRIGAGEPSNEELETAEVKTEVPTKDGRRIDMVISTENYYLPFEMKIWAGDQESQLLDYYEFAKEQAEDSKKKVPAIYYLTPDGHEPSAWSRKSLSETEIRRLSFKKHILPWLEECIGEPDSPSDVLEIMKQLRDNIQGGVRPGKGFSKWSGESDVLDTVYEKLSQKYALLWTECTADYMTVTLNKQEFEGIFLEFALRIKKVSKDTARLYLICGIAGKDGKPDYASAGDYISQNERNFQTLLENTFEDDLKRKIKSAKSAWSRLPEINRVELNAGRCVAEIEETFGRLRPEISRKLVRI